MSYDLEDDRGSEISLSGFASERPKDMGISVHSYRSVKETVYSEEEDDKVSNKILISK